MEIAHETHHDPLPVEANNYPSNECIWSQLSIQLVRYYEDAPSSAGRSGSFNARYLSVWYMKRGSVTARSHTATAIARAGQWLIMAPGLRFQNFSRDAELISINLDLNCGSAICTWAGQWSCVLEEPDPLLKKAKRLGRAFPHKTPAEDYGLSTPQLKMTIAQAAHCQAQVLDFAHALLTIMHGHGMHPAIQYGQDERVRKSITYLATLSLAEKFSRESVARQCGLSPSQLDRLWRSELGISVRHYWDLRRMNYACQSLREKSQSIKEISTALGFAHATQFSLWFSSSQGIPPSAYRRAII